MTTIGVKPNKKIKQAMDGIDQILVKGKFSLSEGINILGSMIVENCAKHILKYPDEKNDKKETKFIRKYIKS